MNPTKLYEKLKAAHKTFLLNFLHGPYLENLSIKEQHVYFSILLLKFHLNFFLWPLIYLFLLSPLLLTQPLTTCLLSSLCSKKNFLLFYFFYAWIHISTYYALFFIENLFLLSSLVLLQRIVNEISKILTTGYEVIHKHKICEYLTNTKCNFHG